MVLKKIKLIGFCLFIIPLQLSFLSHNHFLSFEKISYADEALDEALDEDEACSERLEGTVSAETCLEMCTAAGYTCGLVITYDAEDEDELLEDLSCYTCRKYVCADFGRIDAVGRANCDAQADKKSIPAPPLPDGTPCWHCIDDKDTCGTKWPGSTWLGTCQLACPKVTDHCVKVGTHDGKDCYQCVKKMPPPPPTILCKDVGLLVRSQCKTCKDPTPLCVSTGFKADNGLCYSCEKKTKITCSEFGLKAKCTCKKDEKIKWTIKSKIDPITGKKLSKRCCECVPKKKKTCKDLGYKIDSCSPNPCQPHEKCTTIHEPDWKLKCYKCKPKDNLCKWGGLPERCPGTCSDGQLCIPRPGPCHMCMNVRSIKITWIIIVIETPYGRVVLKDKGKDQFKPLSVLALAQKDDKALEGIIDESLDNSKSIITTPDLVDILKKGLESRKGYRESCFEEMEEISFLQTPPEKNKEGHAIGFGSDPKSDIVVEGPVISCGEVNGKKRLMIYDSRGALVAEIDQKKLEENPDIILESLLKAADADQYPSDLAAQQQRTSNQSSSVVNSTTDGESQDAHPNDPLFEEKKKKKKKFLGIFGSSSAPKVQIGGSAGAKSTVFGAVTLDVGKKKSPNIKDQWGLHAVGYLPKSNPASAWNVIDGSEKNVLVAVIDSGIDPTHPDSPLYIWKNLQEIPGNNIDDDVNGYVDDVGGWNFLNNDNDLTDYRGHGTFVSGIIAAKTNNATGIAGINSGAEIMMLKVTDKYGNTNSLRISRAIKYAVNHGAKVINVSLGARGISQLEQLAINYAHSHGVLVIAASGNDGDHIGKYGPASLARVLSVGAIDLDGTRSTISSWGPNNSLLAPGEQIYSLYAKESDWKGPAGDRERLYYKQSGSSFSAPIVAGTASLLLAKNSQLSDIQLEDILLGTATDMLEKGWDNKTGAGLLNASAALQADDSKVLNVKITKIQLNRNKKKKVESVDVFVTVSGNVDQFTVELGKGRKARRLKTIAGPFQKSAHHRWVARIDKKMLKGSKEWVIKISAKDSDGNEKLAQSLFSLK